MYILKYIFSVFFVIAIIALFKYKFFIINGKSMEPVIPDGSLIVIDAAYSKYQLGDIVVYSVSNNESFITHRIIENLNITKNKNAYILKGDNSKHVDPLPVYTEDIIGKVIFNIPNFLYIFNIFSSFSTLVIFFYIPSGWILSSIIFET